MAQEESSQAPDIAISRASTISRTSSKKSDKRPFRDKSLPPQIDTRHAYAFRWTGHGFGTWPKYRNPSPDVKWHIKWDKDCFLNGRVLIIDYISNEAASNTSPSGKRHISIEAAEYQDLKGLRSFYADKRRAHSAALRVIHVQNASWATAFLLKKFNIDHPSEIVGMRSFTKWARYEKPRQRNGRPFPNGKSFRAQTDPWRNITRTAFGLDYLKTYLTAPPNKRQRRNMPGGKPVDAKMSHLNAYEDSRSPYGYDVSVQRLSVYVQRSLGPPAEISPDIEVRNPYAKHPANGHYEPKDKENKVEIGDLDNTNTVIVFETSASMLLDDCLVQPRRDFETRWRRLSFYLRKEEALNDARLAAQCTNLVLTDIFHGLAIVWDAFLGLATDHVNILEDKIYENPADESRAPELWTNQAAWLKVDKIMYMHQDLVKEMQSHMRDLAEVDEDDAAFPPPDWMASIPAEYERLGHSVQEDLVQPTTNLSDLMYKSVGIRDSRQSLQLGLSMWRLSWITFIFLPLTFVVSFFGMNVSLFNNPYPSVAWWFVAAVILMVFVLFLWYCVKHSLQRRRQTPYQRGLYERLFDDLEEEYPVLWSSSGALEGIGPTGLITRMQWHLVKRWFAPERTIDKRLYSSLSIDSDYAELGAWARFQRYLLKRWLPQILAESKSGDNIALAEVGSARTSFHTLRSEPEALHELAKLSTPLAMAGAEPIAVQEVATYGLRPLSLTERRSGSSPRQSVEDRPSSRGSSGIMIEERNLSDSESDTGEGAHENRFVGDSRGRSSHWTRQL